MVKEKALPCTKIRDFLSTEGKTVFIPRRFVIAFFKPCPDSDGREEDIAYL